MTQTLQISTPSIRLGQLLKLANLVDAGSDAKTLLHEARVRVNGNVETRRGRQVVAGDVVELGGRRVQVECATGAEGS